MTAPVCGAPGTAAGLSLPGGPELCAGAGGAFHAVTCTGSRRSYLEAAAEPAAVPHARRHARQTLAAWQLARVAGDAETIVSELVTNAISATRRLRAPAPVALYLAADPDRLTVLVWDACPELPAPRAHGHDAEGGRGLEIVGALAGQWGACVLERGKITWAWLSLD